MTDFLENLSKMEIIIDKEMSEKRDIILKSIKEIKDLCDKNDIEEFKHVLKSAKDDMLVLYGENQRIMKDISITVFDAKKNSLSITNKIKLYNQKQKLMNQMAEKYKNNQQHRDGRVIRKE